LLYARSIPPVGGHTEFADERAAHDALPEETKRRLEALVAEHSIFNSRARLGFTNFSDEERQAMPPVPQLLVRTIPESGRKSLYLASHAGRILGMSEHDGRALIDELVAHSTQRQFVYTHRWRVHDLVIWDNRCTMHRGTDFDDLRWKPPSLRWPTHASRKASPSLRRSKLSRFRPLHWDGAASDVCWLRSRKGNGGYRHKPPELTSCYRRFDSAIRPGPEA
jgi:alpha-ketoglutarate-dependent 2,4-dichlorophenoxyacetate dioxygenase